MDEDQWDERFKFFHRQVIDAMNRGYFEGDMRDAWEESRRITEYYAGPRPGDGVPHMIADVVTAPVKAVKGGVDMVKRALALWSWLSGKKTAIGAALFLVAGIVEQVMEALPELAAAFGFDPSGVLGALGGVLTLIGLLHKLLKYRRVAQ